jgi:hypothetical protein
MRMTSNAKTKPKIVKPKPPKHISPLISAFFGSPSFLILLQSRIDATVK